jgi:hypothetical protein
LNSPECYAAFARANSRNARLTRLTAVPGIDNLLLPQVVAHVEERFYMAIDVVAIDGSHCVQNIVNTIPAVRPQQWDGGAALICA